MAGAALLEMLFFFLPVCIAFLIGLLVGWVWKPRWSTLDSTSDHKFSTLPPTDVSSPSLNSSIAENEAAKDRNSCLSIDNQVCSSSQQKEEEPLAVTDEDLKHLCRLVERSDGGPSWKHMMDRSTPNMTYQAWQRDREVGPPQYCSRTVYEDATPELLRDFFWDDEFRLEWDDMLLHASTIEECPTTGTMVVHWVRKFPFFCSDREYIIGRRIWESGRSYYCVTKSVPCSSIPRRDKPRRVDLYYSSWSIKPAASKKGNGELTACEVVLFHHEDMGIPWEIAKFGVRQGMWGAVGKIERGLRAYQRYKATGPPLSRAAYMAQINSKVNPEYLKSVQCASVENSEKTETEVVGSGSCDEKKKCDSSLNVPKLVLFAGAIGLACSLDRGLLTKAVIFGVARRFANIGRRL